MTKEVRTHNEVRPVSSTVDVEKTGQINAKNKIGPPTYTIHKNKLKVNFKKWKT